MNWTIVILLGVAYVALVLRIAYWVGGLLAEADLFFTRENRCTCSRSMLCPACRDELARATARSVAKPSREKAA